MPQPKPIEQEKPTEAPQAPKVQCTYCYKWFEMNQTTGDHVVAGSWYPTNVPESVQRFVVSACRKCNNDFSKIEPDILQRLALCLNPDNAAVREIVEAVRRACDPRSGRNQRDRRKREQRLQSLLRDIVDASETPLHKIMPFTLPNVGTGPRTVIRVPTTFDQIVGKWVKGIHRHTTAELIPADYKIAVQLEEDEVAAGNFALLVSKSQMLVPGPGVAVGQWIEAQSGSNYFIYTFELWDVFRVYAAATPPDRPIRELRITAGGDVIFG
jgi:hypothetical protein